MDWIKGIEQLKRVWRGEEKLWKVFWLYGVLPIVGMIAISRVFYSQRTELGTLSVDQILNNSFVTMVLTNLISIYALFILLLLYRCASKSKATFESNPASRFGNIVVRLFTIGFVLFLIYLFGGAILIAVGR